MIRAWLEHLKIEILFFVASAILAVAMKLRKGKQMLDGKELEGKIGTAGDYMLDVTDQGMIKAEAKVAVPGSEAMKAGLVVEIDLIAAMELLAAKTTNSVDDGMVKMIKGALGRA